MSESSANKSNFETIITGVGLVIWLASQYLKHQADAKGISVDEALAQAQANYAEAQKENDILKDLGH